jgi:hypothetical protein
MPGAMKPASPRLWRVPGGRGRSPAGSHVRSVTGSGPATGLRNAQDLLDGGAITAAEHDSIKTKALASA